jgi:NAD(P)-dependent dehydrogenase (short-subunit alcohol dehydrogenase family)
MRHNRRFDRHRKGKKSSLSSPCSQTNIAQAIALEYLRHGAKVAVNHLGGPNDEPLVEAFHTDAAAVAADSTQFITVAGDISKPETGADFVAKIVDAFGRLDVFVSNAGVCQFAEFLEYATLYIYTYISFLAPNKIESNPPSSPKP